MAALRKAWEQATELRGLWEKANSPTREWFLGAVWFERVEAEPDKAEPD